MVSVKHYSYNTLIHPVKPGDDFYMYATGKWYDTATIPSIESRAGARIEMDYTTRANIKNIFVGSGCCA